MKILVVDDSSIARRMIRASAKTVFPHADYYPAENGQEAYLKYVEQSRENAKPDIVMLDHLMPEMDGLETMIKILEFDEDVRLANCRSVFVVRDSGRASSAA